MSVVGVPIANGAEVLNAHKLVYGVVDVLRVRLPDDLAIVVEQHTRLRRGLLISLDKGAGRVRASVDVALNPVLNRRGSTLEYSRSVRDADSCGDVVEDDVVEYQRACQRAVGSLVDGDEGVYVANVAVNDRFGAVTLSG